MAPNPDRPLALFVEDDPDLAFLMPHVVRGIPVDIKVVDHPKVAEEYLFGSDRRPQVVVSDLYFHKRPVGLELLYKIRAQEGWYYENLPLALCTGAEINSDQNDELEGKGISLLKKTFLLPSLEDFIRKAVTFRDELERLKT